jgi:hypothetical protein
MKYEGNWRPEVARKESMVMVMVIMQEQPRVIQVQNIVLSGS